MDSTIKVVKPLKRWGQEQNYVRYFILSLAFDPL